LGGGGLLSWFERRRKSATLKLAQNQILKAIDTVSSLEKAVKAFSEGKSKEARESIEKLFSEEVEIDELRRAVFAELAKGDLPPEYREDLKSLVGRLDRMADFVKDAARNVKILMDTGAVIPREILGATIRIAELLVECTVFLSTSIEMLGVSPPQAKEFALKVDAIEGLVDDEHLKSKILFIEHAKEIDAPTFMVLGDLVESMEAAADMCADTADFVRVLASTEF